MSVGYEWRQQAVFKVSALHIARCRVRAVVLHICSEDYCGSSELHDAEISKCA